MMPTVRLRRPHRRPKTPSCLQFGRISWILVGIASTSIVPFLFHNRLHLNPPPFGFSTAAINMESSSFSPRILVATRLHLGNSSSPMDASKLQASMTSFAQLAKDSRAVHAVVAVDCAEKIPAYDLVAAVRQAFEAMHASVEVLPVTPWNKFVPALNAVISLGAKHSSSPNCILFCSAETSASSTALQELTSHMDENTLVVGARLAGHDYRRAKDGDAPPQSVELSGVTCPWNTLALWNLRKLALTGFLLVSDGLLTDDENEPSYGVEEVAAVALIQNILGAADAQAKLVQLDGVAWQTSDFGGDIARQQWHAQKMQSKHERAARQLALLGWNASHGKHTVLHQ